VEKPPIPTGLRWGVARYSAANRARGGDHGRKDWRGERRISSASRRAGTTRPTPRSCNCNVREDLDLFAQAEDGRRTWRGTAPEALIAVTPNGGQEGFKPSQLDRRQRGHRPLATSCPNDKAIVGPVFIVQQLPQA